MVAAVFKEIARLFDMWEEMVEDEDVQKVVGKVKFKDKHRRSTSVLF